MNVLILGGGGREHAIAWKISQSERLENLVVAPGNAGTGALAENVNVDPVDFKAVAQLVIQKSIQLVIVGPEQPLVEGISDYFSQNSNLKDTLVLGPSSTAARLEGSKDFAKAFMRRHQIPTAGSKSFTKKHIGEAKEFLKTLAPPFVLKADGLAAGKGVLILEDIAKAQEALEDMLVNAKFGKASEVVVVEEFLKGVECSVFILTDGKDYMLMPVAKDYKRAREGDRGLNTGGMGCVSPAPFADRSFIEKVEQRIIQPTIQGIKEEQIDYKGFLFFGLMDAGGEPYVVEYNVRLGDPEAQVVLPRLEGDFLEVCYAAAQGKLRNKTLEISEKYALNVVAASGGYPEAYEKGKIIRGLKHSKNGIIFHAGTKQENNSTISSGGRVLSVTAVADTLALAKSQAYEVIKQISFDKMYYRNDIGSDLLK
ncbi:MAG: phosphoribosylamine--glycine ligase [Bacteroidales bacterium]